MNIPTISSTSGALMGLVAYNNLNKEYELPHKYGRHSHTNFVVPINNQGVINMNSQRTDLFSPKYLVTNKKIHTIYLSSSGNYQLLIIPLGFFDQLLHKNPLVQIEKKKTYIEYTYDIGQVWNVVAEPLYMDSICSFSFDDPDGLKGYMLCEGIYVEMPLLRQYKKYEIDIPVRHLYTQVIPISPKTNQIEYVKLLHYSLWNGFFVEGLPLGEIQKINIQMNGQTYILLEHNKLIQLTSQN